MHQHIEPDDIRRSKRRRLRLPDHWPGTRINLLDRQPEAAHQPQRIQNRKCTDPIRNEIRRVFRDDHAFAEPPIAKLAQRLDYIRRRLRPWNQLDQLQIPRRIKKVRPSPVLLKLFGQTFCNQMHRQAGSIRRNNRARFAKLCNARQQISFDLQIFRDDFDNPVRLSASRQIVIEIPDSDPLS